jgi:maleate cis-trans isomerase
VRDGAEFGWRGLVGWIHSYGMLHHTPQDLYSLLPEGIGILFTTLGKRDQSDEETEAALGRLNDSASLLAANGAEFFVANSTPMVTHRGPGGDKAIIKSMSDASGGVPGTTTTTAAVNAMKAMDIKRITLCTPYKGANEKMKIFLAAEGIEVVHEYGMTEKLTKIHRLPAEASYRVARNAVWEAPECDALYMPGGRLPVMEIINELESDIGIPVIASTPTIVWEICQFFGIRESIGGMGALLKQFPDPVVPFTHR